MPENYSNFNELFLSYFCSNPTVFNCPSMAFLKKKKLLSYIKKKKC